MRVVTLGNHLGQLGSETLPSSQATIAFVRGERGAIWKVLASALLRAVLVAPGVGVAAYMAGARRKQLGWATAAGSIVASSGISLFLLGHYWLQERANRVPATALPANPANALPAGAEPVDAADLAHDATIVRNDVDAGIVA